MDRILHIYTYDIEGKVLSHDGVIKSTDSVINTYDTSFFQFWYLKELYTSDTPGTEFDDVYIHWRVDGETRETSLVECLHNKCPYVSHWIKPVHDMLRVFWGSIYARG